MRTNGRQDRSLRTREVLGLREDSGLGPIRLTGAEKGEITHFIDRVPDEWIRGKKNENLWYFLELAGRSGEDPELVLEVVAECKETIADLRQGTSIPDQSHTDHAWRPYLLARALIQRFQPQLIETDPTLQVDTLVKKEVESLLARDIMDSSMRGEADWQSLLKDSLFILATLPELAEIVVKKLLQEKYWGGERILDKAHQEIGQFTSDEILLYPAVVKLLRYMGEDGLPDQLSPQELDALKDVGFKGTGPVESKDFEFCLRRLYLINLLRARQLSRGSNGLVTFEWNEPIRSASPLPARNLVAD